MAAEQNPQPDSGKGDHKDQRDRGSRRRVWIGVAVVVVFFLVLFLIGLIPRLLRRPKLSAQARAQSSAPIVNVVPVTAPPASDALDLPGNVQAIAQTAVVARASGYIKQWLVDIGDNVRVGQTLATIESPDLDQQVIQARAQLGTSEAARAQAQAGVSNQEANLAQSRANLSRSQAALEQARTQLAQARAALSQSQEQSAQQQAQLEQARTNLNLAHVTATRYQNLLADGAIDRQTTDQAVAAYQASQANTQALQAALRASQSNVQAFRAAVGSSQANVHAYADDVNSSRAAVSAAQANVQSAVANVRAAEANIRSNQANLDRYAVLQGYEKVTAPFSGVITARNVQNGALISGGGVPASGSGDTSSVGSGAAGSVSSGNPASGSASASGSAPMGSPGSSGGAASLFSLAQLGVMRVYINVPQLYLMSIRIGQAADVTVREIPGQTFHGVVVRNAGALDAESRTLVAEVRVNNPRQLLRPGMFADVRLTVAHPGGDVLIPDPALVTNAQGNQVVTIGQDSKVHFQPITLGRDFGKMIEVTSGLKVNQQVVQSPSDTLVEGERVRAVSAPAQKPGAGG